MYEVPPTTIQIDVDTFLAANGMTYEEMATFADRDIAYVNAESVSFPLVVAAAMILGYSRIRVRFHAV